MIQVQVINSIRFKPNNPLLTLPQMKAVADSTRQHVLDRMLEPTVGSVMDGPVADLKKQYRIQKQRAIARGWIWQERLKRGRRGKFDPPGKIWVSQKVPIPGPSERKYRGTGNPDLFLTGATRKNFLPRVITQTGFKIACSTRYERMKLWAFTHGKPEEGIPARTLGFSPKDQVFFHNQVENLVRTNAAANAYVIQVKVQ